uniref:Pyrophosphate--fructose 6-phosphate 1-phosphotransferase subunit beta n=1 Tax=Tetraselmis sp. GSL018 TaxID=582737 RepID=A0A061R021_9CHLO|mmetsp:Transcript_13507/g.31983  ORF Transcript_13507/g.31983 Transcript_13507/m.31983 type:complete len:579 (+) Transcript_13507:138-1874(+)|eukprot:CAMPEP_0177604732 /NCGR_PEP_ID=MMETSP0419_2-20121207/16287_1 /TAXON_ID=582737 /ORGANISM="Tetraselmis sp., Strain GSL018" /LENGTH=578 /DNA_ID=CAMNT_0019098759 /DNA_START=121 /DNA_END=1857 /DNA_ORIENTATION=+
MTLSRVCQGLGSSEGLDTKKLEVIPVRDTNDYSPLQMLRLEYMPELASVFNGAFHAEPDDSAGEPKPDGRIAALFPALAGAHGVTLRPSGGPAELAAPLRVGVVLSGGQAAGGHNVIAGLLDFLERHHPGSQLLGFRRGPAGILRSDAALVTADAMGPFRNQGGFDIIGSGRDKIETPAQLEEAARVVGSLALDGLVVVGGDDSNTNAAILAQHFLDAGIRARVVGVPKTIDGDLKGGRVPVSFGFDTACRVYSELVGNLMVDAASADKYYHFVRLMGRSASHIALEVALQTHPQMCLVSEEVREHRITLQAIAAQIADVVAARCERGLHHGVILIPEGLIEFLPHMDGLIRELSELLARDGAAFGSPRAADVLPRLSPGAAELFSFLPEAFARQLMLDRDPHGNVQVARIETEELLMEVVKKEIAERRASGRFSGPFAALGHYFGYEGRCALPSNFDATYCYNLGFTAAALLSRGQTGLMAAVSGLNRPARDWTVGGVPLTSMMAMERRKGAEKPVIQKALVGLDGRPFLALEASRPRWAAEDCYRSPGPIQFSGPLANTTTLTLSEEVNDGRPIVF